jgi:hypothetical protein
MRLPLRLHSLRPHELQRLGAGAARCWVCLAEVVLSGDCGCWRPGWQLVLWLSPTEPHCVVAVSGGQGGSPIAVPERWSAARDAGGAPEPRLHKAVMRAVCGRGHRFGPSMRVPGRWWPEVRCLKSGSRTVPAGGLLPVAVGTAPYLPDLDDQLTQDHCPLPGDPSLKSRPGPWAHSVSQCAHKTGPDWEELEASAGRSVVSVQQRALLCS